MVFWWKIWEHLELFLSQLDADKLHAVANNETDKFWLGLRVLLQPLRFVPCEGLKLVNVHRVDELSSVSRKELFAENWSNTKRLVWELYPETIPGERNNQILEFEIEERTTAREFFRAFLATTECDSELIKLLSSRDHHTSLARMYRATTRKGEGSIRLVTGDKVFFLTRGKDAKVLLVSGKFDDDGCCEIVSQKPLFEAVFSAGAKVFVADPYGLIPRSLINPKS